MTSVVLGHIPFAIIGILFFGLPNIDGLKFIIASSLLHFFYQVFLLNAYRYGELSEIYPIAWGLSPLIILIVSFLFEFVFSIISPKGENVSWLIVSIGRIFNLIKLQKF